MKVAGYRNKSGNKNSGFDKPKRDGNSDGARAEDRWADDREGQSRQQQNTFSNRNRNSRFLQSGTDASGLSADQSMKSPNPLQQSQTRGSGASTGAGRTDLTSRSTGNRPATTQSTGNSWVRIPYPLSSFYPAVLNTSNTRTSATESNAVSADTENSAGHSVVVQPGDGSGVDTGPLQVPTISYSYGFGASQMRQMNVESVNEAADAIWKKTKAVPGAEAESDES